MLNHARLDRRYCSPAASRRYPDAVTDANDNFIRQAVDPGIALGPCSLYSTSRCHHCQLNCEAGRSTASLKHCLMIASFRERLGNKLAARRYHGRAPAASCMVSSLHERKALSLMAQTAEMFQGSFGDLSELKLICFQSKTSSNAQRH